MDIDSDSRPDAHGAPAEASAAEMDFCRSCGGLDQTNIFKDDNNIEHVTVDQKEMMLKLTISLQAFRNAAIACQICSMLLKVLAFFGFGDNASPRSRIILKLRIGAAQGNPQMVIVYDGIERVIQLYTSARESILIDTRPLAPAPPTRANFSRLFISCRNSALVAHPPSARNSQRPSFIGKHQLYSIMFTIMWRQSYSLPSVGRRWPATWSLAACGWPQ